MPINKINYWTKEDLSLLKEIYNKYTLKELTKIFNRKSDKIYRKARKIGLIRDREFAYQKRNKLIKQEFREGKRNFRGKNNPCWKGGRNKNYLGYIYIYSPNHPNKDNFNRVLEHRLVMEGKLERYLNKDETVHHINGVRDDNRIENLVLFKNRGDHTYSHAIKWDRKRDKKGRFFKDKEAK